MTTPLRAAPRAFLLLFLAQSGAPPAALRISWGEIQYLAAGLLELGARSGGTAVALTGAGRRRTLACTQD